MAIYDSRLLQRIVTCFFLLNLLILLFFTCFTMPENILTFEGSNYFRQRVVLATLSGKSVKIKKIRKKADDPGVTGISYIL